MNSFTSAVKSIAKKYNDTSLILRIAIGLVIGAVLALLINNVYMVPILGIGFSLAPIWYLRSTAASYKKHLNEELETAISIITTSYLRTEDLIRAVKEVGSEDAVETLETLVQGKRLKDISDLPLDLSV